MDGYELIDEGMFDPMDRRVTCPRCGEVAHGISLQVFAGAIVHLACPDGHIWTMPYLDLPSAVLTGKQ